MVNSEKPSGSAPNGRRGAKAGSNVAARTIPARPEATASDAVRSDAGTSALNFDPGVALDAWRRGMAPALRAQVEALKAIERFGRYHYAFAGDYLEWGVAQARAGLGFRTPAEQIASQTTLATQFGEKLQGRVREFVNLAGETRASFSDCWGK